ncbi:cell division inhibitor SulA [Enterobacterales bacterium CwR94]|nr:cell division inhibitor SulA [Enterobacterales bacterium CwR94]
MRTHLSHQTSATVVTALKTCPAPTSFAGSGLVSEVIYHPQQPGMTQMLLLPLLQQLGNQSRWQLWLTPPHKLSRHWFEQSGLAVDKIMQLPHESALGINTLDAMIKALQTGNYSVVLGWIEGEISPEMRQRLDNAAAIGGSLGLIMRPQGSHSRSSGLKNAAIIQSVLYH